ncbi:hypothetical protein MRX96_029070 [Rhipicephalus microplus]
MLLAIAEHGLAVPHQRRVVERMKDPDHGVESFALYFSIYLVGCALCCVALVSERIYFKLKQRRQRLSAANAQIT